MRLYLLLFISIFAVNVFAQDLISKREGNIPFLKSTNIFCNFSQDLSPLISTQAELDTFINETKGEGCNLDTLPLIDFEQNSLFVLSYSGVECHSTFRHKLEVDDAKKRVVYHLKIIAGGYRAGGKSYTDWLLLPKVPNDYSFFLVKEAYNEDERSLIWTRESENLN